MPKKGLFKTDLGSSTQATDPEALFRDLRGRSPEIRHLWSHQADLLRAYHQRFQSTKNVAIELPTGAGKTLVGLLIAEYRRQAFSERVAYLCPTRQLARQVGVQSAKYGIKAHVLIGKQRDYPPVEFSEFQSSTAIAVTTYSAIFNSNPRIDDADALILDDAHASENYIASLWSVEIKRKERHALYCSLVDLLRGGLPDSFYADITGGTEGKRPDLGMIELVPGKYFREYLSGIRDLLDSGLEEKTPPWYSWHMVREHATACSVFVSYNSILIRPFIPPVFSHAAFTRANQRVYMSATLGAGGELERITGTKRIERLPIPAGWDKRGSGRRLFLVPQVAMNDEDALQVVLDAAQGFERSLVLAPTDDEADDFRTLFSSHGLTVLGASDIEDSIDPFVTKNGAALILSRYDGLDLPDEACRLLVIAGLPSGTNLQEKFLWSRVSAYSLLRDRVLTRFTQGVGRCTRSDNDFAVVFVCGRSLVDFILKQDNRRILHAELQAELQFGIQISKEKGPADFGEFWQAFISQSEDRKDAEEAIVRLRDQCSQGTDPVSARLRATVADELSYLYHIWNGDYESALTHARKIADSLEGDETKSYRGWWYYLAADAATALYQFNEKKGDGTLLDLAKDLLRRAGMCCPEVSWLARQSHLVTGDVKGRDFDVDEITARAIEHIRAKLTEWGIFGSRFEREITQVAADLQASNYKHFHRGLKVLGEMLGFRSEIPNGEGDPDCVWSIGSEIHVVHEAKSDHTSGDPIGINDIRQAQSHMDWVSKHCTCNERTQVVPIIESPRTMVSEKAIVHAKTLCHVLPAQLKELCEEMTNVLRRVRARASALSDEKVLEMLYAEVKAAKLTPRDVVKLLSEKLVLKMPTTSGGSA
jgi:hypothetical protein